MRRALYFKERVHYYLTLEVVNHGCGPWPTFSRVAREGRVGADLNSEARVQWKLHSLKRTRGGRYYNLLLY